MTFYDLLWPFMTFDMVIMLMGWPYDSFDCLLIWKESGCFPWTKPCDSHASRCPLSGQPLCIDFGKPCPYTICHKNSTIYKVQDVFNQEAALFTEIQNVILKLNWEKFLVIKELHNVTQVWKSEQYKVASTRNFTRNINMATCIYFKLQGRG